MAYSLAPSSPLPLPPHFHSLPSPRVARLPLPMPPRMSVASASSSSFDDHQPDSSQIPKMEPFNRSRISRSMREPSLLEKAEHALTDRCMVLEGDEAYQCWEALFEFENLKEEYKAQCDLAASGERSTACRPLERFENLVRQSSGVSSLIDNVRMISKTAKMHKASEVEDKVETKTEATRNYPNDRDGQENFTFPEPGDLPPTLEELELEKSAMMPESPFTRVLRRMASHFYPATQL